MGNALGFIVPVLLVPNNGNIEDIEKGLNYLFYGCAVFSTIVFVLQLLCKQCFEIIPFSHKLIKKTVLQSAPPTSPSYAQASRVAQSESVKDFLKSLWKLMKNINFVLIFAAYSINLAVFSAITTFLNQMILPIYPVSNKTISSQINVLFIYYNRMLKMMLEILVF